ncbi:MAG: aldo/keto reductase [Desulfovibrionaceae bacterium]|nr:aldo/keto reductase [Desulfovibrionaceae bacterium]
MEYRKLPRGNEEISVIGLGGGSLAGTAAEIVPLLEKALENGINYFDLAPSVKEPFKAFAQVFAGCRKQIVTQMHFGAVYHSGEYGWTRNLDEIKKQFAWQLELLKTDYTDIGLIHCIDSDEDFDEVMNNGLWDYLKELKDAGVIRHLGFSSHHPGVSRRLLDTGVMDLLMFSINPAYDYRRSDDELALGEADERAGLYRLCEKNGVGIAVMKAFGGGQLLDAATSPFRQALSHAQCLQYAFDRPAVFSVMPGVRNIGDLDVVLQFFSAGPEEKDYSILGRFTPQDMRGVCVYCNHCQPCPAGLNIGLINKYYDLVLAGDVMTVGHYRKLSLHADVCVKCGHCEARCPFEVKQEARMEEIAAYFARRT